MQVHKEPHQSGYTIITNAALRDKRLSLSAVGLLLNILSLPRDWNFTMSGFAKARGLGIETVRSAMRELLDCGYAERMYRYHAHGLRHNEFIFYEKPLWQDVRSCDERSLMEQPMRAAENPTSADADSALPTQLSTLLEQNQYLLNNTLKQSTLRACAKQDASKPKGFNKYKNRQNRSACGYAQNVIHMEDLAHLILPLESECEVPSAENKIPPLQEAEGGTGDQTECSGNRDPDEILPCNTMSADERTSNAS